MKSKIMYITCDEAFKVIKQNIYSCIAEPIILGDIKFHHSTEASKIPSILKYGLISKRFQTKKNYKDESKYLLIDDGYSDESDYIYLSTAKDNIDSTDIHKPRWRTYNTIEPDIIVSKDINPTKLNTTYSNEYVVKNKIPVEMFKAIDVKLFKCYEDSFNYSVNISEMDKIQIMLNYYNDLKNIAVALINLQKQTDIYIPLREVSSVTKFSEEDINAINLDAEKISELPTFILR